MTYSIQLVCTETDDCHMADMYHCLFSEMSRVAHKYYVEDPRLVAIKAIRDKFDAISDYYGSEESLPKKV